MPLSRLSHASLMRRLGALALTILVASACAPTPTRQTHVPTKVRSPAPPPPKSGVSTSTSRLTWPLDGGYISSGFGNQRHRHQHRGIDIRVPPGTPIRAAAAGRITFSGKMRGYGNVVFVDHGDGLETRYAHNRSNGVRKNDSVAVGSLIAVSGSSGNATAPHLHFEVREDGQAKDPLAFLPASNISFGR